GASPLSTIKGYLSSGYSNGDWNGSGIQSSSANANNGASVHKTALGYAAAPAIGISSFAGQSVDGSAVVVAYVLAGDANLDGRVNALGFNALASKFGSGPLWSQADFNYDYLVNTND